MRFLVHFLLAASILVVRGEDIGGQSPIDIKNDDLETVIKGRGTIGINYWDSTARIFNNGSSPFRQLEVEFLSPNAGILVLDRSPFRLKSFHIHIPSEHHLNGKSYPMEVHLVHQDIRDNIAVVGVFYEFARAEDDFISQIEPSLRLLAKEDGHQFIRSLDLSPLVPPVGDFFRYNGSLTTPNFDEGVIWNVFREPKGASLGQFLLLGEALKAANARAIQPLNGRTVFHYVDKLIETI